MSFTGNIPFKLKDLYLKKRGNHGPGQTYVPVSESRLYQFSVAAVADYHKPKNNKNLLFHSSEGQESEIKASAGPCFLPIFFFFFNLPIFYRKIFPCLLQLPVAQGVSGL